jgi:hypothetical protein
LYRVTDRRIESSMSSALVKLPHLCRHLSRVPNQISTRFGIHNRRLIRSSNYQSVEEPIRRFVKQCNLLFAHPFRRNTAK